MTSPDPVANTLANRIAALQQNHPWMDPQVTTTLAASDSSDDEVNGIADALRAQVQQTWDGISHYFDDPVLHKQPTASMALRRYITGSLGAWPVADNDLAHIQGQLVEKGFLQEGSFTPGVWDAGSQAGFRAYSQERIHEELAGNKPGSVSSGGLLHSILHSLNPSGAASAVVGYVKSIPGDVQDATSAIWSGLKVLPHEIANPIDTLSGKNHEQLQAQVAKDYAATNQALGGDTTEQDILNMTDGEAYAQGINAIGTIFLLGSGKAAVESAKAAGKKAAGEGLFTRLSTEEAVRQQGVIAKSLLTPVGKRAATGAAIGGTAGGVSAAAQGDSIVNGVLAGAAIGAVGGAVIPKRAYGNLPILGRTGPMIEKTLANDGLYYTARTKLATPYQFGAVRAAGTTLSQAQAFSLKAHAVSYLESKFGPDAGAIQQAISTSHPLDPINASLNAHLKIGGFGLDLDDLMWVLHGPMKVGAEGGVKNTLIGDADRINEAVTNAFGQIGALAHVEYGTGKTYNELLAMAGGQARLNTWIETQVKQHAAYMHAEEAAENFAHGASELAPARFSPDWYNYKRAEAAAVWNDPEAMRDAVARLLAPNNNYLTDAIKAQIKYSGEKPNAYLKHSLSDYLDAGELLSTKVLPHETSLLTPAAAAAAKNEANVARELGPASWLVPVRDSLELAANPDILPGSIGLARTSTLLRQDAISDAKAFAKRVRSKGDTQDWYDDINAYLHENFAMDARRLSVYQGRPDALLSLLDDSARSLAAQVHLAPDAPAELVKAFSDIEAKGYRVVFGSDIGHNFRTNLPSIGDLGAPLTRQRKIASALGLNNRVYGRESYGADRSYRISAALQKAHDNGQFTLPPYYTVRTLIKDLQDDKIVGKELGYIANGMFALSRRAHKGSIDELVSSGRARSREDAEAMLKRELATQMGLRQLRVKDVKRVLTREVVFEGGVPRTAEKGEQGVPLMSEDGAAVVFREIQRAYSQTPASLLGAQKIEDVARFLPFKTAEWLRAEDKIPLGILNLPNQLAQFRDTYRFTLSPFFSLRRITKTNFKMAADGVTPTITPVRSLRERGVFEQAHAELDRIVGNHSAKYKHLDEADRYLDSVDVFGLYNPRHFEAHYVWEKKAAGASDDEIREGIVRVFQYGKNGMEGRSAFERTLNVIWFPFSFEKTVVRNIGGYLLDKPVQALVLSNALDAYREMNNHHMNNPLLTSWMEKHAPIMDEALRLNAFAHGISMGELGGVNRPFLNMLLPQSWDTSQSRTDLLKRFVPAQTDLARIWGELQDQGSIVTTALHNGMAKVNGEPSSLLNPRPVAQSKETQFTDALAYRAELITAFQSVIDYNNSVGTDEQKYHFGYGEKIPDDLQGAVINKTNIGYLVQHKYPTYDPTAGAVFAQKRQREAEIYIRKSDNAEYADFYDKAKTAIAHLNGDDYPPEQAIAVTALFRDRAIEFASKDASFRRFYDRTFRGAFGPLEAIR